MSRLRMTRKNTRAGGGLQRWGNRAEEAQRVRLGARTRVEDAGGTDGVAVAEPEPPRRIRGDGAETFLRIIYAMAVAGWGP